MSGGQLARRLTTADAVMIGLGAMIGAGVFAALGPAARAAGAGLLLGLLIAAVVAYANAASSAQLAALYPQSGGTYVYGRERLGGVWGYLAGWGFVVGKTASCAAMALTFGAYAAPQLARPLAVAVVVALTAVNVAGVRKTAGLTRLIVAVVLAALAAVVVAALGGGEVALSNLRMTDGVGGVYGVLQSGGLLFFAFAGYARIATLGEEVVEPRTTIPRAIPIALGLTLAVYATVALAALLAAGPQAIAAADAPLAPAVEGGSLAVLAPAVRIGATVASAGVLLSLLVGVSRTTFAMARDGHLPAILARVSSRTQVPAAAELTVATVVIVVVASGAELGEAIGFSSFAVLFYYTIANASAWTLRDDERRWPRWLAGIGVFGCILLAVTLPPRAVLAGAGVLALGLLVYAVRHRNGRPHGR
ncbi:MAG: APC family permease [Nitriliruptoraceae bacterium]